MRIVDTPGSGDWFKGGVVAYEAEMKYRLLAVPEGPVITREAAVQMARGVLDLMGSDIAVATTGVAGPETEEGQSVGTVYVAIVDHSGEQSVLLLLKGGPGEIRESASAHALQQVIHSRRAWAGRDEHSGAFGYELAVPEGGFVIMSPSPLTDVSIVGANVAFAVDDHAHQRVTIQLVGLGGGPSPEVLLAQTGAAPMTPGERDHRGRVTFQLATGSNVDITWSAAHLAPVG